VFGRWEHPSGLRDTMSMPFQLVAKALHGEEARLLSARPKDWIYAPDLARALCGLLDCAAPRHRLYNVGAGRVCSVEAFADALRRRYPAFTYHIVAEAGAANVDYHGSPTRPPMSIERLRAETGFAPRFGLDAAFADYAAWIEQFPSLMARA
jgi:nucleoside-diphosphate-sugar epimerase